jgi:glycosyltransferase involved in cell wall biosynthesis
VHIIIWSIDPREGGMEQSVCRIAEQLASCEGYDVYLYTRSLPTDIDGQALAPNCEVVNLEAVVAKLLCSERQPGKANLFDERLRQSLDITVFRNEVGRRVRANSPANQVVVSFYISWLAIIGQQIADELSLPHVACVRGSDFALHFHSHTRSSMSRYIYGRADLIVATNELQRRAIAKKYDRFSTTITIPNSVATDTMPYWRRNRKTYVKVVADTGYSCKKGSHMLFRSISELRGDGLDVRLSVAGPMDRRNAPGAKYWMDLRESLQHDDPEGFDMLDLLSPGDVAGFVLDGDCYCSASLSEGSSNAVNRAMTLGIPMVITNTGSHGDMVQDARHVKLCRPGDPKSLTDGLRALVQALQAETVSVDRRLVDDWRDRLHPETEKLQWKSALQQAIEGRNPS